MSSRRFPSTHEHGSFHQYSHLYQSLSVSSSSSSDLTQQLTCQVDEPLPPSSPNTYSTSSFTDSPTDSLLIFGTPPPHHVSSDPTPPRSSCRFYSTSAFLPPPPPPPPTQLPGAEPNGEPVLESTPPRLLSTDDFQLPTRFTQLVNSTSPVSPWAAQLNRFYTSEFSKIQTEFNSALSRIYTAQTLQLEPLVTKFHRQQLTSLNERVSRSVSLLETYQSPLPYPPAQITPACMHSEPIRSTPVGRRAITPSQLKESHAVLDNWLELNIENPYPTRQQINMLSAQSGLSTYQVKKWFCNKRSRTSNTRPFVEIMKLRRQSKRQKLYSQTPY